MRALECIALAVLKKTVMHELMKPEYIKNGKKGDKTTAKAKVLKNSSTLKHFEMEIIFFISNIFISFIFYAAWTIFFICFQNDIVFCKKNCLAQGSEKICSFWNDCIINTKIISKMTSEKVLNNFLLYSYTHPLTLLLRKFLFHERFYFTVFTI